MVQLQFDASTAPTILYLGAHCDDIEIGCGGTVMQLARRYPKARFVWVTLSSDAERAAETRAAAERLLHGAREYDVHVEEFRGSYFPSCFAELKDYFEGLKALKPDVVFTHFRNDLHQDHRVTNELTWNAFRNHLVLEYEIPKFDGDLGVPNVFIPLTRAELRRKCDVVTECFPSQASKTWFSRDTFEAIARLRGIECNAPEGFAEAFYGRKLRLNPFDQIQQTATTQ
ncbi:MAG TPA: PIG-L deacetylase family protein [Burkholderiales bacterium]|jgi:LmbE family N-acetylglucosaminyl deacetylase|nr:PIG-L deacetylase family protein [Burkholderiales bacterium]